MMYQPKHFNIRDDETIYKFLNENPLATVITNASGETEVSFTPVILDDSKNFLEGHVARANPIWKNFLTSNISMFLFAGPHSYISPSWYLEGPHLPTWNYTVISIKAEVEVIEDNHETVSLLHRLTQYIDKDYKKYCDEPDYIELISKSARSVVGFRGEIKEIKAKFKLSQNKNDAEIGNLIDVIRSTSVNKELDLATLMSTQLNKSK